MELRVRGLGRIDADDTLYADVHNSTKSNPCC